MNPETAPATPDTPAPQTPPSGPGPNTVYAVRAIELAQLHAVLSSCQATQGVRQALNFLEAVQNDPTRRADVRPEDVGAAPPRGPVAPVRPPGRRDARRR